MGHEEIKNGHTSTEGYKVSEAPLGTTRRMRVIVIGAGASGLNTAHHLDLHMENAELVIYEKNLDVGGTWFENRYLISSNGTLHKCRS